MKNMFRMHARTRITLGLVLLVVSVLLLAIPLGLVPDRRRAVMQGRATLCESLAIAGSAMIQSPDIEGLGKVLEQVKRANGITQNMNRFAHSVDETIQSVDIADTLKFMIILSSRLSDMKRVSFTMDSGSDRIEITTNPFLLQNVIWLCLDCIMNLAKSGDTILISVEDLDSDVLIRFSGVSGLDGTITCDFPAERESHLLEILNGKLRIDNGKGEIILCLKH